ncbi:uncharacterized protein LOC144444616 [Glandiceps talaboti]
MSSDTVIVYIQSSRGGNALPFECQGSDKVATLAEKLRSGARRFKLEPNDIELSTLELFVCLSHDKKRKLQFNEGVEDLKDQVVEFDCHLDQQRVLYVKHCKAINPVKVKISNDDKVCDLANVIREKASDYSLAGDVLQSLKCGESEVKISLLSEDGEIKPLDPLLHISEIGQDNVVFEVETEITKTRGRPMKILVKHSNAGRTQAVVCWENDTVFDVINEIREDFQRFGLGEDIANEVADPDKTMVLLRPGAKMGAQSEPMDTLEPACVLKDQLVSFRMESHKIEPLTTDDIEKICVGQTIAFFGAPGHGKSATINTIGEAIPGVETPLTDTWNRHTTGTMVISPHFIQIGKNFFNLLDVPGDGLGDVSSKENRDKTGKTISWILEGKFPKDAEPGFWRDNNVFTAWLSYVKKPSTGKVDAVVIIHDGSAASVDMLDKVVVDEARKLRGNGVPVLAVMTHVDKIESDDIIREKKTELSIATGIDEVNIFPISNLKTQGTYLRGTGKDDYVLWILKHMLSRSKRFKENV